MGEGYTVGGDTLYEIIPPALIGQTFSPLQAHRLEYIDINVKEWTLGGDLWATLHDLADDPNMVGGGISSTKRTYHSKHWPWQVGRVRFTMRKKLILVGHTYGILIHSQPSPWWNKHSIQYDAGDATYPRGKRFTKANWAAAPVYFPNDDLIFAEFGEPPPPPPVPPTPEDPPSPIPSMALMDMLITSEEYALELIRKGIIKKPLEHEMEAALDWKRSLLLLLENIVVGDYPTQDQLTQFAEQCHSFSEYYYYLLPYPEYWEWPLTYEENLAFAEAYAALHDYLETFLAWLTKEPPPPIPPKPPPPIPPNPPIDNWFIRDITQELTDTGYKIYITTDTPSHLWMRWTIIDPRFHKIPVTKRGVIIFCDVRFCFVVYQDLEQEEPGDTIMHTFICEPWPVCQTRWFMFWGTVNGIEIPSTSGLFYKHRMEPPGPPPIPDQCIIPTINGGFCQGWNANATTFMPDHNYILKRLAVRLNQADLLRKGPVLIKLMTDEGTTQEGTLLWQTQVYSLDCPPPGSQVWSYFDTPAIPLLKDTSYRIVIHTIAPWYYWSIKYSEWRRGDSMAGMQWWKNTLTDEYPRGQGWYGWNFQTHTGSWIPVVYDMNFICEQS